MATRFALGFAETADNKAVTQVPILLPIAIKTAEPQLTIPPKAIVCKIPIAAEELCITAVITKPTKIANRGLVPIILKALMNNGEFS